MSRLICPFCKEAGALLNPEILQSGAPTSCAVSCRNPACCCYDPIIFGWHPDMHDDSKATYTAYMEAIKDEADFNDVDILEERSRDHRSHPNFKAPSKK